jgi:hypothetical protein
MKSLPIVWKRLVDEGLIVKAAIVAGSAVAPGR